MARLCLPTCREKQLAVRLTSRIAHDMLVLGTSKIIGVASFSAMFRLESFVTKLFQSYHTRHIELCVTFFRHVGPVSSLCLVFCQKAIQCMPRLELPVTLLFWHVTSVSRLKVFVGRLFQASHKQVQAQFVRVCLMSVSHLFCTTPRLIRNKPFQACHVRVTHILGMTRTNAGVKRMWYA